MSILKNRINCGLYSHVIQPFIIILAPFVISILCSAQVPLIDIEGRMSLYLPQDSTSVHIGKNAGINQDLSFSRNNTFVGFRAGNSNLNATGNSFFGSQAGLSNTFGESNSHFGRSAGRQNTTGSDNSFFGRSAGFSNTSGSNNSFFGSQAGNRNMIGTGNSFFGKDAGLFNTSGSYNSYFGNRTGIENNTGDENSLYGYHAGNQLRGSRNVFLGTYAGSRIIGDGNVFIGYKTGIDDITNPSVFVLSNKLFIHNNFTPTPLIYGEFDNDYLKINGSGDYADLLRVGTNSPAPAYPSSGEGLELVYDTDSNLGLIQSYDRNNNSWGNLYLGNGNTGIGTINPSVALDVIGDIEYTGSITDVSDIRLKENIEPIEGALGKVLTLEGFTYNLIGEDSRSAGFSAQDILKVLPEAVKKIDGQYYGVDYTQMIPLLLEAIKELKEEIAELEIRVNFNSDSITSGN